MKDIKEAKHTIYLSTDNSRDSKCKICNFKFEEYTPITKKINHYIKEHNYSLLYVGQESIWETSSDSPFHSTVAVLAID